MRSTGRHIRRLFLAVLITLVASLAATSPVAAHAELRQASPGVDETVGGTVHQIAALFIGLDPNAPQDAWLTDPAGVLVETNVVHEGQRIVLPITDPLVAGQYTVNYALNGIDGDLTRESYTFRYDPTAAEASGITLTSPEETGFDYVSYGLLLIGAALAAFLVHRFLVAWKEHRAAQS